VTPRRARAGRGPVASRDRATTDLFRVRHDIGVNQKRVIAGPVQIAMGESMGSARPSWPAGSYEGELLAGNRHGRGIMRFWNGNVYRGEFIDDKFEGTGEYMWVDGRTFKGQFKADKINGKGIACWPDGRVYDGEWSSDLADGRGILTLADHRVFEGIFKNDFPVRGQMIEADGTTFLSHFDASSFASEWRPYQRNRIGFFDTGWSVGGSKAHLIREFTWDDGRRFAGNCVGYCPSFGVFLESDDELYFVVFDGRKTFAEGPCLVMKRKLNWQV
jgi:hypothetical protein